MKRLIPLLLALFATASFAQGISMSYAAKIIPSQLADLVSPSGWIELDDTPQYRLWMTAVQPLHPAFGMVVTLKEALKGVDGSVTGLRVASFNTVCGTDGTPPNYAQEGISGAFDEHGWIDGSAGGPEIRIVPGTNLALAVTRACLGVKNHSSQPAAAVATIAAHTTQQIPQRSASPDAIALAGECSIPAPSYPMEAMRMGQHGVVDVAFTVGAGGHPIDLQVTSKMGVPALNKAALNAVSQGTCNIPKGTRMGKAITFSLR